MFGRLYDVVTKSWTMVWKGTGGAAHVYGLAAKASALAAASTYSATEVLGFLVTNPGTAGNWTLTFVDGGIMTVPYTGLVIGREYHHHLTSITSATGGTAVLYIPS